MNKKEFTAALESRLAGLPPEDIKERLSFYGEMIDDRVEEGLTEQEAIEEIGGTDGIISQIAAEVPLKKLVKEKVKAKRSLRAWHTALIAAGFPVWFPLIIAAAAVVFSLYVSVWAVIGSVVAVDISLCVYAAAALFLAAVTAIKSSVLSAAAIFGTALVAAGLFILVFFACKGAIRGFLRLTKKALIGLKTLLLGREGKK